MNGYLNFLNLPNAVRLFQTTCNLFRSIVSDTVVDNDTLPLFTQGFDCFASRFGIVRINQDDGLTLNGGQTSDKAAQVETESRCRTRTAEIFAQSVITPAPSDRVMEIGTVCGIQQARVVIVDAQFG